MNAGLIWLMDRLLMEEDVKKVGSRSQMSLKIIKSGIEGFKKGLTTYEEYSFFSSMHHTFIKRPCQGCDQTFSTDYQGVHVCRVCLDQYIVDGTATLLYPEAHSIALQVILRAIKWKVLQRGEVRGNWWLMPSSWPKEQFHQLKAVMKVLCTAYKKEQVVKYFSSYGLNLKAAMNQYLKYTHLMDPSLYTYLPIARKLLLDKCVETSVWICYTTRKHESVSYGEEWPALYTGLDPPLSRRQDAAAHAFEFVYMPAYRTHFGQCLRDVMDVKFVPQFIDAFYEMYTNVWWEHDYEQLTVWDYDYGEEQLDEDDDWA